MYCISHPHEDQDSILKEKTPLPIGHSKGTFAGDPWYPAIPSISHTCQLVSQSTNKLLKECLDVHGEHDSSAHDQSGQSRHGPGPEGENSFVLEDLRSADKAVFVAPTGLEGLHPVPSVSGF